MFDGDRKSFLPCFIPKNLNKIIPFALGIFCKNWGAHGSECAPHSLPWVGGEGGGGETFARSVEVKSLICVDMHSISNASLTLQSIKILDKK